MSEETRLSELLAYLVIAHSNCALYSPEHQSVEEFSKKALPLIDELFEKESFTLTLLSDSFLFNDTPVAVKSPHIYRFIKILKSKNIERIIVKKGVSVEELKAFITALAVREERIRSNPHITVGILEVRFEEGGDLASLMDQSVAKVNEIYEGVSKFRRLDIRGIEDVVGGFITAIKKEVKVLQSLKPVKAHSSYTYIHETNVSILTIFQAELLGLEGEALHDAGLAGLLHDMGKLFVPKEIIDKQESLNDKEWEIMKLHPLYGALYLSDLQDIPRAAVIAAYEHHLKYDGSGYPETTLRAKKQHLISQLVTIADAFDAVRTKRGYQTPLSTAEVVQVFKQGSGKAFNPLLVDNFITACEKSKAL
jgi:HD-GYP domain-containing protein (c-di-GMP phosphodiesterase class II)